MNRVHELTKSCLDHVLLLLQPRAVTDVAKLHRSAADCVESLEARARKAGFSAEHARLIKYALVAILDEFAQAEPGPVAEYWEHHLLQRDYFNEVRAGEGFFGHLEPSATTPACSTSCRSTRPACSSASAASTSPAPTPAASMP